MDTKPIACLIYDFDKTLSPNNMQEYGFLRGLQIEPAAFWAECRAFAVQNRMDSVLAYMYKMKEKAQGVMELSRDVFRRLGGSIEFFPGVTDWFGRINAYGDGLGLRVEHYIVYSRRSLRARPSRLSSTRSSRRPIATTRPAGPSGPPALSTTPTRRSSSSASTRASWT